MICFVIKSIFLIDICLIKIWVFQEKSITKLIIIFFLLAVFIAGYRLIAPVPSLFIRTQCGVYNFLSATSFGAKSDQPGRALYIEGGI